MASDNELLKRSNSLKIFKLSRITYEKLWDDALSFVKQTYSDLSLKFNSSSPFSQLLSVMLHLGRMILYYIEDSITGLNISTAWRPSQIRGLARLTGHDPSRAVASRAAVRLKYSGGADSDNEGAVLYIPNKTEMLNVNNGQQYVLLFGAETARVTMKAGNYIDANIVQGTVKYQTATGSGENLQSFNFAERNYSTIDQYYVNVYVNGELWDNVSSLLDMGCGQHACMVKTGQTGGLDVFFGNGDMGAVPAQGATVMCEYLVTTGLSGNLSKTLSNSGLYWEFKSNGYLADGTSLDLNELLTVTCKTDIMFGAAYEDVLLTQEIAPHTSRSMVLANATNYKYFLKRMNIFSEVDVIQGFNTEDDAAAEKAYQQAQYKYQYVRGQFESALSTLGSDSDVTSQLSVDLSTAAKKLKQASLVLRNAKMDDNTVYLFLIPDITARISSSDNYFTCEEDTSFKLTDEEKYNILNLIDMSGESIISIENKILTPRYPRFAVNVQVRIWEEYSFNDIYSSIVSALSSYFLSSTRRDRIPLSDIIAAVEALSGIDTVSAYFTADKDNYLLYGTSEGENGIDEYGDVTLERSVTNSLGNTVTVRDLYPLFRGGFTSTDGLVYSSEQSIDTLSAVNVTLIGYSSETNSTNISQAVVNA